MNSNSNAIAAGGKNLKWLGILTIILGVLAMFAPLLTGLSIVVAVGILVTVAGIARMVFSFGSSSFGKGLLRFALGLLTLICGILLVSDPLVASGVLTVMVAFYLLMDGGFEIAAAISAPPAGGRGWMLFGGIVSILLGLMIWKQFPLSGAMAMGIFLGVKLLLVGMAMVGIGRVAEDKA